MLIDPQERLIMGKLSKATGEKNPAAGMTNTGLKDASKPEYVRECMCVRKDLCMPVFLKQHFSI